MNPSRSGQRLRMAVIGCGKVAQNLHLPALAKSAHCEVVALCDTSPVVLAGVAKRYSIERVYERPADLLADPLIDAVLIAVGDPLHVELGLAALDAGKHVLIEKPLGTSAAQCRPLREAVRRTGRKLQVGLMKRHDPGIQYAKRIIEEELGQLTSFSIWYRACADRFVDEESVFLPVLRDPHYKRPAYKSDLRTYYLLGHGVHLLDQLRYTMGEVAAVRSVLSIHDAAYSWHGQARLRDGVTGNFELSVYIQSEWSEGFDVFGEHGSVSVRTPNPFFLRPSQVSVFSARSGEWRHPAFADADFYLRQLGAFARSVCRDEPVCGDVTDGIKAHELIEAVAASAAADGTLAQVSHD